MSEKRHLPTVHRSCDSCTACCEGWLSADIKGHKMHPGRPCFFLAAGKCTDYPGRPTPCVSYDCAWKQEPSVFPAWMRPDLIGVIVSRVLFPTRPDLTHYEAAEAAGKLDVRTLNWLVQWALSGGHNLLYQVDGKHHAVGSPDFVESMRNV